MEARIYATTCSKLLNGTDIGTWIDCNFLDSQDIYDEAITFHSGEQDPHIIFLYSEWIPEYLYSPNSISEQLEEYLTADEDKQRILFRLNDLDYHKHIIDDEYREFEDWDEVFNDWMDRKEVPKEVRYYIDTEQLKKDLEADWDFTEIGNKVIEILY